MKRVRGPVSMSINEEIGLLVDGFDYPPMMMCAHHTRYQGAIAEACGLTKAMDLYGWRYTVAELPPRVVRAHETISALPEVKIRTMRMPDRFQEHDKPEKQYAEAGLDAAGIAETVLKALRVNSAGVEEALA